MTVVELVLNSCEVTLLESYSYSSKSIPDSIVWCQVVMNTDNRYLHDSDIGCTVRHHVSCLCSLVTCVSVTIVFQKIMSRLQRGIIILLFCAM